jgi:hypothetical protein
LFSYGRLAEGDFGRLCLRRPHHVRGAGPKQKGSRTGGVRPAADPPGGSIALAVTSDSLLRLYPSKQKPPKRWLALEIESLRVEAGVVWIGFIAKVQPMVIPYTKSHDAMFQRLYVREYDPFAGDVDAFEIVAGAMIRAQWQKYFEGTPPLPAQRSRTNPPPPQSS